jgi:ubiquinone/menaquinone biosynthesis C-methylase UbiE
MNRNNSRPHNRFQPKSAAHRPERTSSSWENVNSWYNKIVGSEGHYYHEHVVLPGTLKLLQLKPEHALIDLGCGQGVLARAIPPIQKYLGIDAAPGLIEAARRQNRKDTYDFITRDAARPIHAAEPEFTHATIILALQNMEYPQTAIQNAANHLVKGGKLVMVLNHPCFRIPRQSGWNIDEKNKQQYRWLNRYLSPLKIPINMHPGKSAQLRGRNSRPSRYATDNSAEAEVTWSFHRSLQDYSEMLRNAGFVITRIEEWTSDKESEGKAAKQENRARAEFPLFMAIQALKQ